MNTFNYTFACHNLVARPAIGAAWLLRGAQGVRRPALARAALAVGCLLMAGLAQANILFVTNAADSGPGTLRQAIPAALPGGVIIFAIPGPPQPIVLTSGEIDIGRDLFIFGPVTYLQQINGNQNGRVFHITRGNVFMSALQIQNGYLEAPPAPGNTLTSALGGGVYVQSGATLELVNCYISGNAVKGWGNGAAGIGGGDGGGIGLGMGGGIFNSGTLVLLNCTFSGNSAIGTITGENYWPYGFGGV